MTVVNVVATFAEAPPVPIPTPPDPPPAAKPPLPLAPPLPEMPPLADADPEGEPESAEACSEPEDVVVAATGDDDDGVELCTPRKEEIEWLGERKEAWEGAD